MANAPLGDADAEDAGDLLFGHPKGVYILTVTEMWERFSFYGVRALLVLYLTQRFLHSDETAFALYGSYMALVNISPLIGGTLADRYLGFRKAVILGGILIILGNVGLILGDIYFPPHVAGKAVTAISNNSLSTQIFYLALAFIITGTGFMKPSVTSMVGGLYPQGGHRSDSGFTIFFLGVNIGAALAAVFCGYVGQKYGWRYGFGLAGLGVLTGFTIFLLGQKYIKKLGLPPPPRTIVKVAGLQLSQKPIIYGCTILFILLTWQLVPLVDFIGFIVVGVFVAAFGATIIYGLKYLEKVERERLFCALILMTIWIFFAALIEQMGSSMNLFAARAVDLDFHLPSFLAAGDASSFRLQSSQLLGIPGLLIIGFSPVIVGLWGYLAKRNLNPPTAVKFSLSLILLGAGFSALALGAVWSNDQGQIHILWMIICYFLFAVADLFIVPVGLSAVTKLAAPRIIGFMMGLWLLSVAIGQYFSALIAQYSSLNQARLLTMAPADILSHYQSFFGYLGLGSILLGLIPLFLLPLLKKWMHGVP